MLLSCGSEAALNLVVQDVVKRNPKGHHVRLRSRDTSVCAQTAIESKSLWTLAAGGSPPFDSLLTAEARKRSAGTSFSERSGASGSGSKA